MTHKRKYLDAIGYMRTSSATNVGEGKDSEARQRKAIEGGELNATATPLKPGTYRGKILVLHGVDDPVVPDDQTMAFWKEMRDAKENWEFVAYGNALYTFTNWLMPEDGPPPAIYNKQADRRSWIAMRDFFKEIFA